MMTMRLKMKRFLLIVMRLQKPSSDDVDIAFTNALFTTKNNRSSSPRRQRQ